MQSRLNPGSWKGSTTESLQKVGFSIQCSIFVQSNGSTQSDMFLWVSLLRVLLLLIQGRLQLKQARRFIVPVWDRDCQDARHQKLMSSHFRLFWDYQLYIGMPSIEAPEDQLLDHTKKPATTWLYMEFSCWKWRSKTAPRPLALWLQLLVPLLMGSLVNHGLRGVALYQYIRIHSPFRHFLGLW